MLLDGNISKSMRVTAQTQQRLFEVFFNHYAHTGIVLVFSGDILSSIVKPWMREEKSVNREILLEENTGSQQDVL